MIKVYATLEQEKELTAALKRMVEITRTEWRKAITDASEAFLQAASKETPPDKGRAGVMAKRYNRPIIKLKDPRYPNSRKRTRYKVPYKTNKKQGSKYVSTKKEAKEAAKIKHRGIGRAGWFLSLLNIGKPLTAAHQRILAKSPKITQEKINSVAKELSYDKTVFEIINSVEQIANYAERSRYWGLIKAKNKINGATKEYKRRIKQEWQK